MEILGCVDISTTWIFLAATLLLIYVYGKRRNRVFKDAGIPGPEPIIYIGNLHQIIQQGVQLEDPYKEKYGKVYGRFMGGFPVAKVTDIDIIKEILIKNFSNFPDRLMCDRISSCSKLLTQNLLKAAADKTEIVVKDYFGAYTLDVIASTAFGIDADSQNEMDCQMMKEAKKVFSDFAITNPATLIVLIFPGLAPLFKALGASSFPKQSIKFFEKTIMEMINTRKTDPERKTKRLDFLQLLLDAEDDGTVADVSKTDKANCKKMSHDEVLGQALLFFVAGYETTANTLHFVAYSLATNPEVQQRLVDEIDSVLGDEKPNYDNIGELTYLDHVITETLRLYPIVTALTRKTEQTVVIKGVTFPKDMFITIPTLTIHRDPDVYPEPHKFNPDRWDRKSEIDPMNYLPFGHGPRHCIGRRLAQIEMRIALAHLLKKVTFLPGRDTPVDPCAILTLSLTKLSKLSLCESMKLTYS